MGHFHQIIFLLFSLVFVSCSPKSVIPKGTWEKVCEGFNFPEGPTWDGKSALYVSNCKGDWMAKIQGSKVEKYLEQSDKLPELVNTNGLLYHDGFIYACEFGKNAILKIDGKKQITVLSSGTPDRPMKRPNDIAMGPDGYLYVTDPFHYDRANPDGVVYKIDPNNGETTIVIDNMAFPNGIAFSPDNQSLYVCESAFNRVLKFSFHDGRIGKERDVFIELPGGDPDGIAFDVKGNLYIAHFGGGAVYMVNPSGEIACKLDTPGKKPTNLDFGGNDMKTLYLTEVETNAVYKLQVPIAGKKLY